MNRNLNLVMEMYLDYLWLRHFSPSTIHTRGVHLQTFLRWCNGQGICDISGLSSEVIEDYQRHLATVFKQDGKPLQVSTQHSYLLSIRSWLTWGGEQGLLSPALSIEIPLPTLSYRLPRVLGAAEIERVLEGCSLKSRSGIRDRAMLEALYSSGIRRMELLNLKIQDLDWHKELVTIRMGKGRKDRIIPIGERALAWIDRYLWEVRPAYLQSDETTTFLTRSGRAFTPNHLSWLTRKYIQKAFPHIEGACHVFRHSMATLMLEGGADIRFIQQMLGHAKLSTTQIYAHVSVQVLKEVHGRTHPGAKLRSFTKEALRSGKRNAKVSSIRNT